MIATLVTAGAIVAAAVVLFALSIRVGILVGHRLDRAIEQRSAGDSETPTPADTGESIAPVDTGQEEKLRD